MATVERFPNRARVVSAVLAFLVVILWFMSGSGGIVGAQGTDPEPGGDTIPQGANDPSVEVTPTQGPDAQTGPLTAPGPVSETSLPVPFPQILNAPLRIPDVQPEAEPSPELEMAMLTVPRIGDEGTTFAINFASTFEIPVRDYRLSLVVGDPNADRTRYRFEAGQDKAIIQKRDGERWVDMEKTAVDTSTLGTVTILVPPTEVPDGSVIWVEVEKGKGDDVQKVTSPYFDYKGLALGLPQATMVSTPVGWAKSPEGKRLPDAVAIPDSGVKIMSEGQDLIVTYADPVPAELAGSAVSQAVDHIKIATGSVATGAPTDEIQIDRTTGSVKLVRASGEIVEDADGQSAWIIEGLRSEDPGGPGQLRIEMHEVATALGTSLVYTDPNSLALGVDRTLTLVNGNVVTASGVLATLGWFDFKAPEAAPTTTIEEQLAVEATTDTGESGSTGRTLLIAGIIALVAVAAIAVATISVRRRNERREAELAEDFKWGNGMSPVGSKEPDTMWLDLGSASDLKNTNLPLPTGEHEPPAENELAEAGLDEPKEPENLDPVDPGGSDAESAVEEAVEIDGDSEADDPSPSSDEDSDGDENKSATVKRNSPDDVLAAFEAELSSISERLDRLSDDGSS